MNKAVTFQAADIFEAAAAYIREYGWQVTGMSQHGQPRCSMGALASAYPAKSWNPKLSGLMYQKLYQELGGIDLTEFNHKHRSGEEVAQLFERVAANLRSSQTPQARSLNFADSYGTKECAVY